MNWKSSIPSLLMILGLAIMLNAYRPILERLSFAYAAGVPILWTTTDVLVLLAPPIAVVVLIVLFYMFKRKRIESK